MLRQETVSKQETVNKKGECATMKVFQHVSLEELKANGLPTFNLGEHYVFRPDTKQNETIVIDLGNGKYMTVCVMPGADNIDVKFHGKHKCVIHEMPNNESGIHAFYDWK
ncbi:hypothetical protein MXL46_11510 [Heyndrickxia sporothermodurans]|uniref:hypothetical protein n=1 Tax=Heyndrickxia sporothermodurans TaxID=46224 RepID=UPI002DB90323|nr:hypothetical protein [Heyndrickxia sporothermodurans]MEB6549714.1 hypothetical protein [Heyndrickxia sporothermodurans]